MYAITTMRSMQGDSGGCIGMKFIPDRTNDDGSLQSRLGMTTAPVGVLEPRWVVVVEVSVEVLSHLDVDGSGRDTEVRTSGLDCPGLGNMSVGSSCNVLSYGIEFDDEYD